MNVAKIPNEKAIEPDEDARQPLIPPGEPASSQISSSQLDVLSQPSSQLSHRDRLQWLQDRRLGGLWAQCDACSKSRYLPEVLDRFELPDKWYCHMNPDPAFADCSVPEKKTSVRQEEDLIHADYAAGSVVWARMNRYPWWPAMVCDCPDTEQYYWIDGSCDIPVHYHVVFFDEPQQNEVTRSWIPASRLKPYAKNKLQLEPKDKKYKRRIRTGMTQANDAIKLPLKERLAKYTFLARYKGPIVSPKDNKKQIEKEQHKINKKLRLDFDGNDAELFKTPKNKHKAPEGAKIVVGSRSNNRTRGNLDKDKEDSIKAAPIVPLKKRAKILAISDRSPADFKKAAVSSVPADSADAKETSIEESQNETQAMEQSIETETNATSEPSQVKQSTSLVVEVGSKDPAFQDSMNIQSHEGLDDDTSKTYVPESESQQSTQPTEISSPRASRKSEATVESPGSDDFEY